MSDPKKRSSASFRHQIERKLTELKRSYITFYIGLLSRARLDVNENKRKAALTRDGRLKQFGRLATIDLMPASQLKAFKNSLAGPKTCFGFMPGDLEASPVCPRCYLQAEF